MRAQSARAIRNANEETTDEIWPLYLKPLDADGIQRQAPANPNSVSTAAFGLFIVFALLLGSMGLSTPEGSGAVRMKSALLPFEDLRRTIKNHAAVRLKEDFSDGVKDWKGFGNVAPAISPEVKSSSSGDWSFNHGFAQPGRLRLWADSMQMTDYQLEFVGQIEKKGLGWAYRAKDHSNYYATKIRITRPGPLPLADLTRFAVISGRENSRVVLPLPVQVRADTLYRVLVNVRGDSFSTSVNGQMVDTWTDPRLKMGGIGFFADHGEVASLRWVTVSERDNFLGRILSYLGLFTPIQPTIYVAVLP